MKTSKQIALIIPAYNEAESLPLVLSRVPSIITRIIVVDNGSSDGTGDIAKKLGAEVVSEQRRGYGSACLAGIEKLKKNPPDIVAFADADGSDGVENLAVLIQPMSDGSIDFSLARRFPDSHHALSLQQRFGNRLAVFLIRLIWGYSYHDLGPMRAITWNALRDINMRDKTFGWTVEMQIKAAVQKLRITEYPLPYHDRIAGKSKISRTVSGIVKAGGKILWVIFRELLSVKKNRTAEFHK